ncbi:unnamed protein product [Brachionus calyciflorus]|uniref:Uncharacterized protein n=1 Tax=Brachionus calyciflorus TaxID=104777 RepID=A0A814KNC9_9BILA|nr:unnamed protein product [Brachionus calyciflorus]
MSESISFYKRKHNHLLTGSPKPRQSKKIKLEYNEGKDNSKLLSNDEEFSIDNNLNYFPLAFNNQINENCSSNDYNVQLVSNSQYPINVDSSSRSNSFETSESFNISSNLMSSETIFDKNDLDSLSSTTNSSCSVCLSDESYSASLSDEYLNEEDSFNISLMCLFYSSKMTQQGFNITLDKCIKNILKNDILNYEKKWFCKDCSKYFHSVKNKLTNECECGRKLQTDYKLSIEQQLRRIFEKNGELFDFNANTSSEFLKDFHNGRVYNDLLGQGYNKFYTFLLNTDGIEMCNKSNMSIWPIILVLNELSIDKRFCFDNIIIAGLSIENGKPNLGFLLESVKDELKKLEFGTNIENNGFFYTGFFLVSAVFDKPARSSVLSMVGPTSFYSCLKCFQIGRRFRTGSK